MCRYSHEPRESPVKYSRIPAAAITRLSRYTRALEELGVELILANSPQAKGRIERLWNTCQDRLVVELAE